MTEEQEAKFYSLHQKYAQASNSPYPDHFLDLVWTHGKIVGEIAVLLGERYQEKDRQKVDLDLAYAGGLVHDIGVYQCYFKGLNPGVSQDYVRHSILGGKILVAEGLPYLERFALTHVGVGLSPEDVYNQDLPWPKGDYRPKTVEEMLVSHADKFHSKHPGFNDYEKVVAGVRKYGEGYMARLENYLEMFGLPDLDPLKIKYGEWHRKASEFKKSLKGISVNT